MVLFDVHRISLFCFYQFIGFNCLYHDKIFTFSRNFFKIFLHYLCVLFPMHNRFSRNTLCTICWKMKFLENFYATIKLDSKIKPYRAVSHLSGNAMLAECMCLHHCFVCVWLYPLVCYLKVWHTQSRSPNYEKLFKLAYLFKVSWKQLRISRETRKTYMRTYIIFDSTSGANFPYWIQNMTRPMHRLSILILYFIWLKDMKKDISVVSNRY